MSPNLFLTAPILLLKRASRLSSSATSFVAELRSSKLDMGVSGHRCPLVSQASVHIAQRDNMLKNGIRSIDEENFDPRPVVKFFTPDGSATWLLTELDPDDNDIAFGLCDLGMGCPELGSVRISELTTARGPLGLPIERDLYFTAEYPLSVYAESARAANCITA